MISALLFSSDVTDTSSSDDWALAGRLSSSLVVGLPTLSSRLLSSRLLSSELGLDEYLLSGPEKLRDRLRETTGEALRGGFAYECIDALNVCDALEPKKITRSTN